MLSALAGGSVGAQVNCSGGSVSACALAPVVDEDEGLGLPEVGAPLVHVGC